MGIKVKRVRGGGGCGHSLGKSGEAETSIERNLTEARIWSESSEQDVEFSEMTGANGSLASADIYVCLPAALFFHCLSGNIDL